MPFLHRCLALIAGMSRIHGRVYWLVVACMLCLGTGTVPAVAAAEEEVNLLVIGDWGYKDSPHTVAVAKGMAEYVQRKGVPLSAVLTTGDNFYHPMPGGSSDPRWSAEFEQMFDPQVLRVPFYAAMGNHDYDYDKAAAVLGYAAENPGSRWKLPAKWYRVDLPAASPLVTVFVVDSNFDQLTEDERNEQDRWLRRELERPLGAWRLLVCHHPLYSNGRHGDTTETREAWGELLQERGFAFALAGHDHNLQHLQIPGRSTSFLVSGGGGAALYKPSRADRGPFARPVHGFAHLRLTPATAEVRFIDTAGEVLHEFVRTADGQLRILRDGGLATPSIGIADGPMLGAVSGTTATVWLRTNGMASGRVVVRSVDDPDAAEHISEFLTTSTDYGTHVARFSGLTPGTEHEYRVEFTEKPGPPAFTARFWTPDDAQQRRVRLVFGSCYKPQFDAPEGGATVFQSMADRSPDVVLFNGDFPYTERGELHELRARHRAIRAKPGFVPLTSGTPTIANWDDHEFGPNDTDGSWAGKDEALRGFKEWWANSAYGLHDTRGIFSNLRYGQVEFFLLDCRYHQRQSETQPIMLGESQTEWLHQALRASTARFKVLVSGGGFTNGKNDTFAGSMHQAERDRLLKFIDENRIGGVLVLTGDTHFSQVRQFRLSSGASVYEFNSSPLAQGARVRDNERMKVPVLDLPQPRLFAWTGRRLFGEIDFLPAESSGSAAAILRIVEGDGQTVGEITLSESDLFPTVVPSVRDP